MTRFLTASPPAELIPELDRSSFADIVRLEADAPSADPYRGSEESTMRQTDSTKQHSEWITPRQAAEYLNVGVDIIYDGCAAGGLKHVRLGHRTIRLRREWLDAWAEAHARVAK